MCDNSIAIDDNRIDDAADAKISECLNPDNPRSFFLFAGAGSGKTGSLVKALGTINASYGDRLRLRGQRVGVITYTNNACDEIKHRIKNDAFIYVSTIHSFVWDLICGFNHDIKQWLISELQTDIFELGSKSSRTGTKAENDRINKIASKRERLKDLEKVRKFTYNPNTNNTEHDSLNHTEVLQLGAYFLNDKPLMGNILIKKFPILLIDESQDTNKGLMEAFLAVQKEHKNDFSIGLFGDTMQRIYGDGKPDLDTTVPEDWEKPAKKMNHRSPARIIEFINKIRSEVDTQKQQARKDKEGGFVRLFIVKSSENKQASETGIMHQMAIITGDEEWNDEKKVVSLILEHHMAANRMGFGEMFDALYSADEFRTGLLDGTLSEVRIFSDVIFPLLESHTKGDNFRTANIVKKNSQLFKTQYMNEHKNSAREILERTRAEINKLYAAYDENPDITFGELLQIAADTQIFGIPRGYTPILRRSIEPAVLNDLIDEADGEEESVSGDHVSCLDKFLRCRFSQIKGYVDYIGEKSPFFTHQGVKGLEFPRVMAIIDDEEARGFMFSYDKLFGIKSKTDTDRRNEYEGKETGIDRTRRLLYVICSRAKESLAVVAYTSNPATLKTNLSGKGWFADKEIIVI